VDLVIDGGRSRCRAALYRDDGRLGEVATGPGVPAVAEAGGPAATAAAAAFARVLDRLDLGDRPLGSACVGVTGVLGTGPAAELVAAALRPLVRARRILVTSDVVTGYCGAVGLGPGVVVAAGTGAIALAVARGAAARVDGWGWLLGDAGSGFEVGRRGLAAALRAHDGRGGSPLLAKLAERELGPLDEVVRVVHGAANPVRVVAGFAEQVAEAAGAGDPLARAIWDDAAAELAATALAAAARVRGPEGSGEPHDGPAGRWSGPGPSDRAGEPERGAPVGRLGGGPLALSWTGGLWAARDLLLEPFLAQVGARAAGQGLAPAPPLGSALDGGRLLADSSLPAPFDALVHQTGGQDP
jgi:glucosamine kinase